MSHARLTVTDDVQIMTLGNRRPHSRPRRRRGLFIGLVLWGAALLTELAKPAAERTWEGRIAGIVPYDLRRPTVARLRQRVLEHRRPAHRGAHGLWCRLDGQCRQPGGSAALVVARKTTASRAPMVRGEGVVVLTLAARVDMHGDARQLRYGVKHGGVALPHQSHAPALAEGNVAIGDDERSRRAYCGQSSAAAFAGDRVSYAKTSTYCSSPTLLQLSNQRGFDAVHQAAVDVAGRAFEDEEDGDGDE